MSSSASFRRRNSAGIVFDYCINRPPLLAPPLLPPSDDVADDLRRDLSLDFVEFFVQYDNDDGDDGVL